MRFLIALVMLTANPVLAEQLTIERIFASPAISGVLPQALKISPDGKNVTFLRGRADEQARMDLWTLDVASGKTQMLVDSEALTGGNEVLSDAELARRERQRTADLRGIAEYYFSDDGHRLLFPLAGALYVYDLRKPADEAVTQLTQTEDGFATDPRFSPQGRFVSFVRDQNLFVVDLDDGEVRALTADGSGTISYATAEFVAQEEMDRDTGYWWAPDDSAIALTRVDESPVAVERRFEIYADRTDVVDQRYPAAGKANVAIELGVLDMADEQIRWIDLGADKDIYLARVKWLPGSNALSYQRINRNQRRLELVRVDLNEELSQTTLLTEERETFVNLNYGLRFVNRKGAFVWMSERDGFAHLYTYKASGELRHRITQGAWQVDEVLALDGKRGRVYFAANADDLLGRDIYMQSLDPLDPSKPRKISSDGGWHKAVFADNGNLWLDTWSHDNHPPQVRLRDARGKEKAVIAANTVDDDHPYAPYLDAHLASEYGELRAIDGQPLYYQMIKPAGFDPRKRYPVVIRTYGGPHAQVVYKVWDSRFGLFDQYLAQQGFIVFSLDNRGSARRGTAFENPIYRAMAGVEVEDQQLGIQWLREQEYVDPERIGVHGWSYGGYMSLHLWARTPTLAAAVAVAPVTDWRLYDTFYTERYMDLPQANEQGYNDSNVLNWLDKVEDPATLSDRLHLIHGMADDNVLFTNSTAFISKAVEKGIRFNLMTYPGGKHGLKANPAMRVHVFNEIANFLILKLQK